MHQSNTCGDYSELHYVNSVSIWNEPDGWDGSIPILVNFWHHSQPRILIIQDNFWNVILNMMCNRMSHKSTIVVETRFTPRNHAPGHSKSQIFWNFWNPSLKNTLFFEQKFRLQLHLAAYSGWEWNLTNWYQCCLP